MTEKVVGNDTDKDGWTTEIVVEVQPDGSLLIASERRYKTTIDVLMEEQEAGLKRQLLATGAMGKERGSEGMMGDTVESLKATIKEQSDEIANLKHDLDRYIEIAAKLATELEELKSNGRQDGMA